MQPSPCRVLGIFGLHPNTTAHELKDMCHKYGEIDHVDLITDRQVYTFLFMFILGFN